MKRVRIAKGQHVTISDELAEKAARAFGKGLSRAVVDKLSSKVPVRSTLMAGSPKPLTLAKRRKATDDQPQDAPPTSTQRPDGKTD